MTNLSKVMAISKIIAENIRNLHRNLVGANFFSDHALLEEWYHKMDDISDDIVETGIMLGEKEKSLLNLNGVYASVPEGTNFSNEDVFQYVYNFFHALIDALIDCKSEVPGDVYSHFEEHIFYLRKEADYKIKHRLGSK